MLFFNAILPKTITRKFLDQASKKFTLGFSNTPGAIKPLYFLDKDGNKIYSIWTQTYMIVSGYVGLAINC